MSIIKAAALNFLTGTTKVLHTEPTAHDRWYAAIRERDADELTPEISWAYAATEDEAITAAFYHWLVPAK